LETITTATKKLIEHLRNAGLEINEEKSQLVPSNTAKWLGHQIFNNRIEPIPER
jgi:hypothetical protein